MENCVDLLDPYVTQFENKGTGNTVITAASDAAAKWKGGYYPKLAASGLICGGEFFGDVKQNP